MGWVWHFLRRRQRVETTIPFCFLTEEAMWSAASCSRRHARVTIRRLLKPQAQKNSYVATSSILSQLRQLPWGGNLYKPTFHHKCQVCQEWKFETLLIRSFYTVIWWGLADCDNQVFSPLNLVPDPGPHHPLVHTIPKFSFSVQVSLPYNLQVSIKMLSLLCNFTWHHFCHTQGGSPMSRMFGTHITSLEHFYHSVP